MRALVLMLILSVAATGCGVAITDYQRGYQAGRRDVREMKKERGVLGQAAAEFGDMLALPGDSTKSADWNAGFQNGRRDEIKDYYR